jgi:hypothetical protein
LDTDETIFGKNNPDHEENSNLPLLKEEFIQNMRHLNRLNESSDGQNAKVYVNHEHFFAVDVKGNPVFEQPKKKPKFW